MIQGDHMLLAAVVLFGENGAGRGASIRSACCGWRDSAAPPAPASFWTTVSFTAMRSPSWSAQKRFFGEPAHRRAHRARPFRTSGRSALSGRRLCVKRSRTPSVTGTTPSAGDRWPRRSTDDRLEVTSSGRLHFGLTPEALFEPHESLPWNPLIARVFYLRGIIEQWGRGHHQDAGTDDQCRIAGTGDRGRGRMRHGALQTGNLRAESCRAGSDRSPAGHSRPARGSARRSRLTRDHPTTG